LLAKNHPITVIAWLVVACICNTHTHTHTIVTLALPSHTHDSCTRRWWRDPTTRHRLTYIDRLACSGAVNESTRQTTGQSDIPILNNRSIHPLLSIPTFLLHCPFFFSTPLFQKEGAGDDMSSSAANAIKAISQHDFEIYSQHVLSIFFWNIHI